MIRWLDLGMAYVGVPVVLGIGALLWYRYRWQVKVARLLGYPSQGAHLQNFSYAKKRIQATALFLGFAALAIALARPRWGEVRHAVAQQGRDVLIMLDVSRSMLAQDVQPSRIEQAKQKISRLVSLLTAERVSLLTFSDYALVQCPFTADEKAFLSFLELAEVDHIQAGTTALDQALLKAIQTFRSIPARKERIVVMFTDGEDFSSQLAQVQQQAQELGIHIFTVGVGTRDGAPIPVYDVHGKQQGHLKDDDGQLVITRLDEQTLSSLAAESGAQYVPACTAEDDIQAIATQVHALEKDAFEDKTFAMKEERYGPFAWVSLVCILFAWMV